jgi:hypothetical protein
MPRQFDERETQKWKCTAVIKITLSKKTCADILKTTYERLAINATIAVPYLYFTADLNHYDHFRN